MTEKETKSHHELRAGPVDLGGGEVSFGLLARIQRHESGATVERELLPYSAEMFFPAEICFPVRDRELTGARHLPGEGEAIS